MEQITLAPPPLPPKTRRAPPEAHATVLERSVAETGAASAESAFVCGFQEVASPVNNHVVKIRINPENSLNEEPIGCIRISVNSEDMLHQQGGIPEISEKNFFYYGPFNSNGMSSGQVSPSDTLDSGTCSDLDGTPPPLPKKISSGVSVTLIGQQNKRLSNQEGDSDNDSNISCDSLNSGELHNEPKPESKQASSYLPQGLLKDIRERSMKPTQSPETISQCEDEEEVIAKSVQSLNNNSRKIHIDENSYQSRKEQEREENERQAWAKVLTYETDKFYKFHLNENMKIDEQRTNNKEAEDEYFAGYKDLLGSEGSKTIRSAKGTVRGVKNRVRAGIATFLQINSAAKSYKEKDMGKVVVYTTTMGIVRETYNACTKVKQILRTLLVKYEERDVFMSSDYQTEIRDRMRSEHILVPQVFVDGQHIGDVEIIERLNETGELRRLLKEFKTMDVCTTCKSCGGYRLLPCPVCNGSKKSVHRNHFTTEFVALKCMNCDEVGLVKCTAC